MTLVVWRLEWSRAVRRPRLLQLNVAVPLVLVASLALGGAPAVHASVAYATLFVFFATFGSAIPLVRDAESGLLGRVILTGAHPGGLLVQRCLAGAALDVLQLLPSVLLIGVVGAPAKIPMTVATLALTLLIANILGAWIAALARSVAEAALFGAVVALLLLHVSGVFRTPPDGSLADLAQTLAPFSALHASLLALSGLATGYTTTTFVASAVAWCVLSLSVSGFLGGSILRRLC